MKILFFILAFIPCRDVDQMHAEREARLMAEQNVCDHLLGCSPKATFSGVGRSKSSEPKTCLPWEHGSDATEVIADAIVEKDGWFFRSRHWK